MKIIEDDIINKILLVIVIVISAVTLFIVLINDKKTNNNNEIIESESIKTKENTSDIIEVNSKIKIDIKGAVQNPGVYELDYGSRVDDAINAAGGLKKDASTKYLNLSKKIKDETVIKVYTEKQINNMQITFEVKEECSCPEQEIINCAGANIIESTKPNPNEETSTEPPTNSKEEENTVQENKKVSINTATIDELTSLNGIGESKAKAIIEYREVNNGFKTIEEIMNVSGIGSSAFNKIKDYITT